VGTLDFASGKLLVALQVLLTMGAGKFVIVHEITFDSRSS
jgi:hypothetical protein